MVAFYCKRFDVTKRSFFQVYSPPNVTDKSFRKLYKPAVSGLAYESGGYIKLNYYSRWHDHWGRVYFHKWNIWNVTNLICGWENRWMWDYNSCKFKVGLSHRPHHQSLIFCVKLWKLTIISTRTAQSVPKIMIRILDFDVGLQIKMFISYICFCWRCFRQGQVDIEA